MKAILPLAVALTLFLGCGTSRHVTYLPYEGAQQDWPIQPGAFRHDVDGIPVYAGNPPRPYTVLGELIVTDRYNRCGHRAAAQAKHLGADALVLRGVSTSTVSVALPGSSSTVYGNTWSTTTAYAPQILSVRRAAISYWLIKFAWSPPASDTEVLPAPPAVTPAR